MSLEETNPNNTVRGLRAKAFKEVFALTEESGKTIEQPGLYTLEMTGRSNMRGRSIVDRTIGRAEELFCHLVHRSSHDESMVISYFLNIAAYTIRSLRTLGTADPSVYTIKSTFERTVVENWQKAEYLLFKGTGRDTDGYITASELIGDFRTNNYIDSEIDMVHILADALSDAADNDRHNGFAEDR